jgi:hypothetical protein
MSEDMKRPIGAALAGALGVGLFLAIMMWVLEDESNYPVPLFAAIVVAGIPVGIVLGWRFASRVGRWHPAGVVAWMAISAVLLGDVEISAVFAVAGAFGDHTLLAFAPFALLYGLVYAIFVLPVTVAAATLWLAVFVGLDRLIRPCGSMRHRSPG